MRMEDNGFISMKMQCPLPKLDYDIVMLGHGSGGLLSHKLLNDIIFKALGDRVLVQNHDAAIVDLKEKLAFTTDSFVVSPLFFPGGNIGDLAVNGTVNDLAMCGAIPKYISLAFIIEEGFKISEFWEILLSIRWACVVNDIYIATGDTKVVNKGSGDKLFINTTGIGLVPHQNEYDGSRCISGDKIIVSGPIASHGMAIMSVRENLEFESNIKSDTKSVVDEITAITEKFGSKIKFLRDPTRGGIGTVLNEVAKSQNLGIELEQDALPILREVSAACELLGLDPLYVANEGIFICIVVEEITEDVLEIINSSRGDKAAKVIGELNENHPSKVVIKSGFGGKRVVNMLLGEQLPRIC